mgnify:CR=1 FL=1
MLYVFTLEHYYLKSHMHGSVLQVVPRSHKSRFILIVKQVNDTKVEVHIALRVAKYYNLNYNQVYSVHYGLTRGTIWKYTTYISGCTLDI